MKADLWEKYVGNGVMITRDDFLAALKEYGELVKASAVKVCEEQFKNQFFTAHDAGFVKMTKDRCAAAIKDMELP